MEVNEKLSTSLPSFNVESEMSQDEKLAEESDVNVTTVMADDVAVNSAKAADEKFCEMFRRVSTCETGKTNIPLPDVLRFTELCCRKLKDATLPGVPLSEVSNVLYFVGHLVKDFHCGSGHGKEELSDVLSNCTQIIVHALKLFIMEVHSLVGTEEGCKLLVKVIKASLFFCTDAVIQTRLSREPLVPFHSLVVHRLRKVVRMAHYNLLVDLLDKFKTLDDVSGLLSIGGKELYILIASISISLDGQYDYLVHHFLYSGLLTLPEVKGKPAFLADASLSTVFEAMFAASSAIEQGKVFVKYFKKNMCAFIEQPQSFLCLCYLIYHWKNPNEFRFVFEEAVDLLRLSYKRRLTKFPACLAEACVRLGLYKEELCQAIEKLYGLDTPQFNPARYGPLPLHVACMTYFQTTDRSEVKTPLREGLILMAALVKCCTKYADEVRKMDRKWLELMSRCDGWYQLQQLVWDKKSRPQFTKKRPLTGPDEMETEDHRCHKRRKTVP